MRLVGFIVLGAAVLAGCGPSSPQRPQGSEGGACFPDDTCDDGLECQSGVCHAAGVPDASMQPRPDARIAPDAPRPDARAGGADAAPGTADAPAGSPDAPPRPDAPPPPDAPAAPDAPASTTGELSLTWSIKLNGAASTCAGVGGVTVEMVATPTGGGAPVTTRFDCTDGAGTTGEIAAGGYNVVANLLDADDAVLDDATIAAPVTVVAGITTPAGGVTFAVTQSTTGVIHVAWDIHLGGNAVSCGGVEATQVEVDTLTNDRGPTYFDTFDCTVHSHDTLPLPVGSYADVTVRLYDILGPLAQVDLGPATVTPDGDTDLGTAHFQIPSPNGRILVGWTISQGGGSATCEDVGADGARIDAVSETDGTTVTDTFFCSDGFDITDALAPDDYDVTLQLLDVIGQPIGDPAGPETATILHDGDAPEVDFVVNF